MTYTYYRTFDNNNSLVFECISQKDDIDQRVYYDNKWWDLGHLYSHFIDLNYRVSIVDFTTKDLNKWLLQTTNL